MMERLRGLAVLLVVLAAGVFIGSAVSQWKPLPEAQRLDVIGQNPVSGVQMALGPGLEDLVI